MSCCHCQAADSHFSETVAEEDLRRYRRKGPDVTTRILLDALNARGLQGITLLDIGSGIGVIAQELLARGAAGATLVEAASAYLASARAEAQRRGVLERVRLVPGDFTEQADGLPDADIVTLDRVVCCYPDVDRLVRTSAARCRTWYGLTYPRDRWYVRAGNAFHNWIRRRQGNPFRTYIHAERQIHALLTAAGFQRQFHRGTLIWQVAVYMRREPIQTFLQR